MAAGDEEEMFPVDADCAVTGNPHDTLAAFRRQWQRELRGQPATLRPPQSCSAEPQWLHQQAPSPTYEPALECAGHVRIAVRSEAAGPAGEEKRQSLVTVLIQDFDEDNEYVFDYALPREVALSIFGQLSYLDLCQCAQVSQEWRRMAYDDMVWMRVLERGGLTRVYTDPNGGANPPRIFFRDHLLRKRWLAQRWREMRCGFREFKPQSEQTHFVLCCAQRGGLVLVAHQDGMVRLFDTAGGRHGREIIQLQPGERPTALAVSPLLLAVGTAEGFVSLFQHNGGLSVSAVCTLSVSSPVCFLRMDHASRVLLCSTIGTQLGFSTDRWIQQWSHPTEDAYFSVEFLDSVEGDTWVGLGAHHAEILRHTDGRVVHLLHTAHQGGCSNLAVTSDHIAFAVHDPPLFIGAKVFAVSSGTLLLSIDLHYRPAACIYLEPGSHTLAVGGVFGVRLYDLPATGDAVVQTSGASVASFQEYARNAYLVKLCAIQASKLVIAGYDKQTARWSVALYDRQTGNRFWYINEKRISSQLLLEEDQLITLPSPTAQPHDFDNEELQLYVTSINVMDFAVADSALEHAECPFSSEYNPTAGYRYSDLLATPYDDVDPELFG